MKNNSLEILDRCYSYHRMLRTWHIDHCWFTVKNQKNKWVWGNENQFNKQEQDLEINLAEIRINFERFFFLRDKWRHLRVEHLLYFSLLSVHVSVFDQWRKRKRTITVFFVHCWYIFFKIWIQQQKYFWRLIRFLIICIKCKF